MLTPLDIQKREFKKGISGYSTTEVEMFLLEVSKEMEKLMVENEAVKERLKQADEQLEQFQRIERTLKDALVVAQSTADEVVRTANDKSKNIIHQAEMKAEKILDNANNRIINARKEYEEAKKDAIVFKTRFRTLLNAQLQAINETLVDED